MIAGLHLVTKVIDWGFGVQRYQFPEFVRREHFLTEYQLSERGFMPSTQSCKLASPVYAAWEALSAELPKLNRTGTLRARVAALPIISTAGLSSGAELRRAYVLLGQIVHSWVHGGKVLWPGHDPLSISDDASAVTAETGLPVVPAQLAVPWYQVCKALGMPLILCAAGCDMWNYRLIDPCQCPVWHC